jgi:hypothetical protein
MLFVMKSRTCSEMLAVLEHLIEHVETSLRHM